jgi:SAM-dependent methyltransferase
MRPRTHPGPAPGRADPGHPHRGEDREALLAQAFALPYWYHTLELAPGRVTTGHVDLRPVAPKVLPAALSGRRALDVGTFDGFWAFELERRGAEVVATDLGSFGDTDWPPGTRRELEAEYAGRDPGERFRLAHDLLGSRVRRVECSIYELDADRIGGTVDLAVVGALLLHLRDPVRGLERVAAALRPGGQVLLVEPFDVALSLLHPRRATARMRAGETPFNWWEGNLACLRSFLALAGFSEIARRRLFRVPAAASDMRQWHVALQATRA